MRHHILRIKESGTSQLCEASHIRWRQILPVGERDAWGWRGGGGVAGGEGGAEGGGGGGLRRGGGGQGGSLGGVGMPIIFERRSVASSNGLRPHLPSTGNMSKKLPETAPLALSVTRGVGVIRYGKLIFEIWQTWVRHLGRDGKMIFFYFFARPREELRAYGVGWGRVGWGGAGWGGVG